MPGVNDKPLGENTAKFLDDVKKGKPRSFLMICKGPKVVFLSVKKKPVKKNELNDAKKDGFKGDPYFGVITGKGMDLVFNLAQADGYDKPPVKEVVLRDFLEEHAGLKSKPTFQVVTESPSMFDEDDLKNPVVARFLKLEAAAGQAAKTRAELKETLTTQVREIRDLLLDADFNNAGQKLDVLEKLIDGGNTVPAAPPQPPAAAMPTAPVADQGEQDEDEDDEADEVDAEQVAAQTSEFAQRLKSLKPNLDKVLAAKLSVTREVKQGAAEASTAAKRQEFGLALRELDDLEPLVKQGLKELAEQEQQETEGTEFNSRLKSLLPQIKEAAAAGGPEAAQVQSLAAQAGTSAKQRNFFAANLQLDEVETLARIVTNGKRRLAPGFDDAWKAAKSGWDDALDQVNAQMEKLRVALLGEEDAELKRIAEFGLNAVTGDHKVPLQAAILELDQAAAEAKAKAVGKVRELVEEFRDHIDGDDQVQACDDNPFGVAVTIRQTLDPALLQMRKTLDEAFVP